MSQSKELRPFLRLPGSDVLPGKVETDLRKVIEKDEAQKKEELTPRFEEEGQELAADRNDNRTKMSEKER